MLTKHIDRPILYEPSLRSLRMLRTLSAKPSSNSLAASVVLLFSLQSIYAAKTSCVVVDNQPTFSLPAYGAHDVLARLVVVVPAATTRVHVASVVGRVLRAAALTHRLFAG